MTSHGQSPTEILRHEHRVIEQVLAVLEKLADHAANNGRIDAELASQALDFFRHFADHCHHAKEEDLLFPALEAKGFPREGGPTGVMLYEHEQGRALIRQMVEAIQAAETDSRAAARKFAEAARQYVTLLRQHISKEDNILFVLAERTLNTSEQAEMLAKFETTEKEHVGEGVHEKYAALADELLAKMGIAKESVPKASDFFCCH